VSTVYKIPLLFRVLDSLFSWVTVHHVWFPKSKHLQCEWCLQQTVSYYWTKTISNEVNYQKYCMQPTV